MSIKSPLFLSAALVLPFLASCASQNVNAAPVGGPMRFEAENATLSGGARVATTNAGFSGTGYVTGFEKTGDGFDLKISGAKAGIYQATVRYSAPGDKGFGLIVNGKKIAGTLTASPDKFSLQKFGKLELKDGDNTIALDRGWGYYDIDYLELSPAADAVALLPVSAQLVNPKADAKTRALMQFLTQNYGKTMFSGQYIGDVGYLQEMTGKEPAVIGDDLMDYSPSRVAFGSKSTAVEAMIAAHKKGQIVTLSWHWNSPNGLINEEKHVDAKGKTVNALWWRGFYTEATNFDLEKTLANPQSAEYKLMISDIDAIAVQLKKLQDAGVPVLWRPLHEADGKWFWWGAKGPDAFKSLWRIMYDRLTKTHDLHNLIWVHTGTGTEKGWYPGDDVVDIYGIDVYPEDRTDPLTGYYEPLLERFNGKKLLALSEFKGAPDIEKTSKYGVKWSYFVSWTGDSGIKKQPLEDLKRIYADKRVTSLDGLKKLRDK